MRRRWALQVVLAVAGCDGGRRAAEAPLPAPTPSTPSTTEERGTGAAPAEGAASSSAGRPDPEPTPSADAKPAAATTVRCRTDADFPGVWQIPEASAAAEVMLVPGKRELLVVSDSGNHGEALLWGIPRGPFRRLTLALDDAASDDLEGAAWARGHLYTLTSSGAVRRFSPDGKGGLARDGSAYAIGPAPYACPSLGESNCGPNYEGLCLRAGPSSARCAGYAASKASGKLFCLVFDGDRLRVDPIKPPVALALARHALSDCAFGAEGGPARDTLLVTTNIYGGATTYVVDEATFALSPLDVPGLPNNEAVAVDADGALYELMDSNGTPSLALRMTCDGWGPRQSK